VNKHAYNHADVSVFSWRLRSLASSEYSVVSGH